MPCFVVNSELENIEYLEANGAHLLSQADYFSCVGTIVHLRKENCMYQACPSQDCNKKVIDQQNGLYRCEKCDREFPNFKYRMMLLVSKRVRGERVSRRLPRRSLWERMAGERCLSLRCLWVRAYLKGSYAAPE